MAHQDPRTWSSSQVAEEQASWLWRRVAQCQWVASWWDIGIEKAFHPQMGERWSPEQVAKRRLQWQIALVKASARMGMRKDLP